MRMKLVKMNKFFKALETIKEPINLSSEQWRNWEKEQRSNRPIAFFFYVTVKESIRDLWTSFVYNCWITPIYAIKYRTTHRYNILHTGLKPDYHDFDRRILHGVFNELVNFVECDKAWLNVVFGDNKGKRGLFERYRSAEQGIEYLNWEMSLQDDNLNNQAEVAKETLALYKWWKEVYLTRKDIDEESGLSEYHSRLDPKNWVAFDFTPSEEYKALLEKSRQIELDRDIEETEMFIRLIKIRKYLWT